MPKNCPWAQAEEPSGSPESGMCASIDLRDVMSEQLIESLEKGCAPESCLVNAEAEAGVSTSAEKLELGQSEHGETSCNDDFEMARLLQMEYDREHNDSLRKEERQFNKANKVCVSYNKYRISQWSSEDEEESLSDDDIREKRNTNLDKSRSPRFGPGGVTKQDGKLISKHDAELCGRQNASKFMKFSPAFGLTGDAPGMDMQLSNRVFNNLKRHSFNEEKRQQRLHDKKDKATSELAVDSTTRLLLFKLVNGGLLESINGIVSVGKEACVLHAYGGLTPEGNKVPEECAIKVFKTVLCEFKNRNEYVAEDYRFKNPRKVLKVWAEKEMLNLNRMNRYKIPCPSVVKLRKHVLIMSFIGSEGKPAPKLKDAKLDQDKLKAAYQSITKSMGTLYDECKLVHGDLSEYNILYWEDEAYFIDVSQSVDKTHPRALEFLARDCLNLVKFFQKQDCDIGENALELFERLTGISVCSEEDIDSDSAFLSLVTSIAKQMNDEFMKQDKKRPADCDLRNSLPDEDCVY